MSPFYIVLATIVIRLVNLDSTTASYPYIVSIYNKYTGTVKGYQICAGTLITNSHVLTTRFCLPRHAYKIRYGDMKTIDHPTYSHILHRKYHPNSKPEVVLRKNRHAKQAVSGSNNIAIALIEQIPDQQFGKLTAIDYRTIVGREVKFCSFDVAPKTALLRNSKKKRYEQNNLKTVFKRKKKILREYLINITKSKLRPRYVRHKLALTDMTHAIHNILRFVSGVVTLCQDKASLGPNMCVVQKCYDFNAEDSKKFILTPDFGTPLFYDGKVVGFAADVVEDFLKFTPISPFLNWINSYVKVDLSNSTALPKIKKIKH